MFTVIIISADKNSMSISAVNFTPTVCEQINCSVFEKKKTLNYIRASNGKKLLANVNC